MYTITNYTIKSELGQGGMATVYLAEDKKFLTNVAIKILAKEFAHNENIRKRFLAEARNVFRMSHPNIIKVTDLIEEGDTVAFVMEYIEGDTLKDYLERKGKLSDEEIMSLFTQMLAAVAYVHEQGLIHRDIKPSNFMISPNGQVKLLDFGIAKNTDTNSAEYTQTSTSQQMGTPMYMSPEQVNETKSVTAQSDIYSLGVVLWQMVMGQKPYDTKTLSNFQLQSKIVNENLALTNTNWDTSIQKATHKNIDSRYTSAQQFLNDLQNKRAIKDANTIFEKTEDKTIFENKEETTIIENTKAQTITPKVENTPPGNIQDKTISNIPIDNQQSLNKKRKLLIPIIAVGVISIIIALFFALREKDSDNDGTIDKYDACMYDPGLVNGCPDSDNDGIVDKDDQCPNDSGNYANGCPDSDNDGIVDKDDQCPNDSGNYANGCFYFKQVTFTNNSRQKVYICIAYLHKNVWSVNGYYNVDPNKDFTYDLPLQFWDSEVFWYAQRNDGAEWIGTDRYFKIDDSDAFKVEDGIFLNGGGNPIKRGFYKLILTTENTNQILND